MIFKLTPDENGWSVDIFSKNVGRESYGFASIATPPLAHPELGATLGEQLPNVVARNEKHVFTLVPAQDFGDNGVIDLMNVLVAMKWNIFSTSTPDR